MRADGGTTQDRHIYLLHWSFFILTIIAVVFIRIRLLEIPLERDEGEYAYMGQLISEGIIPYNGAYSMKLPGTAFMYYVIMSIFGRSVAGIHMGLLAINMAVLPALFSLSKRLVNQRAAIVAASSYAVISLSLPVIGFMAHATHFVVLFAIWGVYFLYVAMEDTGKRRWLIAASGLCLGMAFVMKQHGMFFYFFAVVYLYFMRQCFKDFVFDCVILSVMAAMPFAVTLLIIYRGGVFGNFWFWCFTYSSKYVSSLPLMEGLSRFSTMAPRMVKHFTAFWIFGIIGFIALANAQIQGRGSRRPFIVLFFLFSFLSILPGLYFREHYFVLIIPALSLAAGYCSEHLTSALKEKSKNTLLPMLPIAALFVSVIVTLSLQGEIYFRLPPDEISRKIYGMNPFIESLKIAQYIKSRAKDGDRIAILGSEPQILFYSGLHSATGYIYMYGLMEDQPYNLQMQKAMVAEIEKIKPAFIVFVQIPASWLPAQNAPLLIFDWAKRYIEENYVVTGVIDMQYYDNIVYKFDAEALDYNPRSKFYVCIFKRKDGG